MTEEINLTLLRPPQIRERLAQAPVAFIPVGPLEWHGPHCPYGTDGLNAQHMAAEACRRVGGILWPTLFWGTERERRPDQLESLGFPKDAYIVGMDFPANPLPSCYCPEEIFAVVVRETLRQAGRLGVKLAAIVNGHGAENHMAALRRLTVEISRTTGPLTYLRVSDPSKGSGGHADADETSLMMFLTHSVDLSALPPVTQSLRYAEHAVVDGGGFDGKTPDHILPERCDPRQNASAGHGEQIFRANCDRLEREVRSMLNKIASPAAP